MKVFFYRFVRSFFPVIISALVGFAFMKIATVDYDTLIKPPFAPPRFVFPIAWNILYFLMGTATYLFLKSNTQEDKEIRSRGLMIYYIYLFLNALWTLVFFVLGQFFFAALMIIVLYTMVISVMLIYKKVNKVSFYLFIPLLLWLAYAFYLNIGIFILSK